jgi:hypothetical protein
LLHPFHAVSAADLKQGPTLLDFPWTPLSGMSDEIMIPKIYAVKRTKSINIYNYYNNDVCAGFIGKYISLRRQKQMFQLR